jgi:hypothetical protein
MFLSLKIMFRKLALLPSSGKKGGEGVAPTLWGLLERASPNHWIMNEDIKSRLNLGNTCYFSDQGLVSSRLLSRNVNVKLRKTIILPTERRGIVVKTPSYSGGPVFKSRTRLIKVFLGLSSVPPGECRHSTLN